MNKVQLANGITNSSSRFSLYCIELFEMLLHQKEIYVLSASSSTADSGTSASNKGKMSIEVEELKGVVTEPVISEDAF